MLRILIAAALALGVITSTSAAPDAVHGEQVYVRCMACHALAFDRVGPRHCGLFGRHAGSVPRFGYSSAMKKSRTTWNEKTLDRFLSNPLKMVPGTAMTYDGVSDRTDRTDLIAYLKQVNETPACGKTPPLKR